MNATTAQNLTDDQLAAAYEGACNAEARHYASGDVDSYYAARSIVDVVVREIHRRWDATGGTGGPNIAI